MPLASQFGYAEESTVGTAVTVTKFAEFTSEAIKVEMGRVATVTKRAGQRAARSDRAVPYQAGCGGTVSMPMLTKGHGLFLKHALGSIATAGPTDAAYTHTATLGDLTGKALTVQVDRPFNPSGTSQAFTYSGCKIVKAEWTLAKEGMLEASYTLDGWGETTATALATASYPSAAEIVSFAGSSFTIAGAAVELVDIKITLDNALKTDRRYVRGSAAKKEQLENGMRAVGVQFTVDFTDLTQHNRVVSATQAGSLAALVLTCNGPTLLGVTAYPGYTFTVPAFEFSSDDGISVSDDDPLRVTFTGRGLFDGTNSALTIAQRTADTTPS